MSLETEASSSLSGKFQDHFWNEMKTWYFVGPKSPIEVQNNV